MNKSQILDLHFVKEGPELFHQTEAIAVLAVISRVVFPSGKGKVRFPPLVQKYRIRN